MTKKLLIENGTILPLGGGNDVLTDHYLFIEDGKISRIESQRKLRKKPAGVRVVDARNKVVMPGFINAHTHFYSSFARGIYGLRRSTNFVDVLNNLWWRLDKALTREDVYYSTLAACIESIKNGTTTLVDHHASPCAVKGSLKTIARAVDEAGLRACLCYEVSDRDGTVIAQEGIEENLNFINGKHSSHIRAMFGLHASFTLGDETLTTIKKLSDALGVGFHIHCAEDKYDQTWCEQNAGMRVVERLEKFGLLGARSICAHGVHLDERELNILARTKTMLVHNPQSNMNNAVGVAPLFKMLKQGILVGFGTDAMTTNMLEELRSAIWLHKLESKDPDAAFMECVSLLTTNNPQVAKRIFNEELGELKEGACADLIIADYNPITPINKKNVYGHLVFGLSQAPVDTTIVAGQILMQNKKLIQIDEAKIAQRCRKLAQLLWQRMGLA